ncbi:MAG: phosphatidylglycerol lysyltransferase domain-containing protein [Vicinamibacterales bacterium]
MNVNSHTGPHRLGADDTSRLTWLRRHGRDAVSFQALKLDAEWWVDAPPPTGTGAAVAYQPSGLSWIAIGAPLVAADRRAEAVRGFCRAARAEGRRPVFLGVEEVDSFAGLRTLALGLQSVLKPSVWDATLRRWPKLREQVRRARAKGVTVRAVEPDELAPGAPLRADVERLRGEWLRSRAMEPLGFLVEVNPCYAAAEHLYFAAYHQGRAVQFLSVVPIYARDGWLMEDMLRGKDAPNGTTELLIAALMQRLGGDPAWVTPGLTPLAGDVAWWLRLTRLVTVALYDFSGLLRFRSRLHPSAWTTVWLAWDRGPAPLVLLDVLGAFARGRILRFAVRSTTWHPNGPPWTVAVPLVVWTAVLFVLALTGQTGVLGYPLANLYGWILFDVALAWALFAVARRPRPLALAAVATVALVDFALATRHTEVIGMGTGIVQPLCRAISVAGPLLGAAAVYWAAWLAYRKANR